VFVTIQLIISKPTHALLSMNSCCERLNYGFRISQGSVTQQYYGKVD